MEKWKLVVMAAGAGVSVIGGLAVSPAVGASTVAPSVSSGAVYSAMMATYCTAPADHGTSDIQNRQDLSTIAVCAMPR